jgi:hypothetical protein
VAIDSLKNMLTAKRTRPPAIKVRFSDDIETSVGGFSRPYAQGVSSGFLCCIAWSFSRPLQAQQGTRDQPPVKGVWNPHPPWDRPSLALRCLPSLSRAWPGPYPGPSCPRRPACLHSR